MVSIAIITAEIVEVNIKPYTDLKTSWNVLFWYQLYHHRPGKSYFIFNLVDDQHNGEKTSLTKNSDSAAAASTHSPAEPEEKSLESKTVELNTMPILENGLEKPEVSNGILEDRISTEETKMLGNPISKLEDCNSSKDSIDVESTQPEDIKPVKNETNSTASMDTKVKGSVETTQASSSLVQPANLKEETVQPEIDWSLYHLGDMTLDVWLQIIRKHVVMALLRHPK